MRKLLLFILLFGALRASEHPYYLSIARLEYNQNQKAFALSVWFFEDDLLETLKQFRPFERLSWQARDRAATDSALSQYLKTHLHTISPNGSAQFFRFLGCELEGELVYVYALGQMPLAPGWKIQFSALQNELPGQRNVLHFEQAGFKNTLFFNGISEPKSIFN